MTGRALLVVLLLLGCARPSAPVAPTAPKERPAASVWSRWELPLDGVSAEFPVKPDEQETRKPLEGFTVTTSMLSASHAEHSFAVGYTRRDGKNRPADADWLTSVEKSAGGIGPSERFERGDFRGVVIGRTIQGKRTAAWYLLVGDGFVSAIVSAEPTRFDDALVRRFFDSVKYELPWRVYAAPVGMLSVAVPAAAVEVPAEKLHYVAEGPSRAFFVGGKYDLVYIVGSIELSSELESIQDDELLGRLISLMAAQGTSVSWQAPVEFQGARGVDYLADYQGIQIRGRVLRVDHYLYSLEIRATSRSVLLGDGGKRFFETLRWY